MDDKPRTDPRKVRKFAELLRPIRSDQQLTRLIRLAVTCGYQDMMERNGVNSRDVILLETVDDALDLLSDEEKLEQEN